MGSPPCPAASPASPTHTTCWWLARPAAGVHVAPSSHRGAFCARPRPRRVPLSPRCGISELPLVLVHGDWAPINTPGRCLHEDTFLSIPKDGITGSDGKSLLNSTSKSRTVFLTGRSSPAARLRRRDSEGERCGCGWPQTSAGMGREGEGKMFLPRGDSREAQRHTCPLGHGFHSILGKKMFPSPILYKVPVGLRGPGASASPSRRLYWAGTVISE